MPLLAFSLSVHTCLLPYKYTPFIHKHFFVSIHFFYIFYFMHKWCKRSSIFVIRFSGDKGHQILVLSNSLFTNFLAFQLLFDCFVFFQHFFIILCFQHFINMGAGVCFCSSWRLPGGYCVWFWSSGVIFYFFRSFSFFWFFLIVFWCFWCFVCVSFWFWWCFGVAGGVYDYMLLCFLIVVMW